MEGRFRKRDPFSQDSSCRRWERTTASSKSNCSRSGMAALYTPRPLHQVPPPPLLFLPFLFFSLLVSFSSAIFYQLFTINHLPSPLYRPQPRVSVWDYVAFYLTSLSHSNFHNLDRTLTQTVTVTCNCNCDCMVVWLPVSPRIIITITLTLHHNHIFPWWKFFWNETRFGNNRDYKVVWL